MRNYHVVLIANHKAPYVPAPVSVPVPDPLRVDQAQIRHDPIFFVETHIYHVSCVGEEIDGSVAYSPQRPTG
jgi:hypothetical protein